VPSTSFHLRPAVIALIGLPGTGKTGLGRTLYPRLPRDFAFLDIDTLTQPLVRAALEVSGQSLAAAAANGALRAYRDAQYACLWNQVRELLWLQRSVLVVAPMTLELEDPAAFLGVVASLRPARFIVVRTHASPRTVRSRLERRADFLDELRLSRWDVDLDRYENLRPLPLHGLELDTSAASPQSLAERALPWLRSQLAQSEQAEPAEAFRLVPARRRA
jgi:predicted kinase